MLASARAALLPVLSLLALAACGKKDAAPADSAAASAAATASPAASNASAEAQLADITRYELTMDKLDKYFAVNRNLAAKVKAMSPAEREAVKAAARKENEDDSGGDGDLDSMARTIERIAPYNAAVREAGLTPREFAVMSLALVQTGMASGVAKMRPKDDLDSLAREMKVNPANIRFFREHEAEITRKSKEMQAEMKASGMADE